MGSIFNRARMDISDWNNWRWTEKKKKNKRRRLENFRPYEIHLNTNGTNEDNVRNTNI